MTRKPVLTKRDFVKRFQTGEFGNAPPTWNSLEEWFNTLPVGDSRKRLWDAQNSPIPRYHLRNKKAQGDTFYNLGALDLYLLWTTQPELWTEFYVSEMAPHKDQTIQGEVRLSYHGRGGLELFYTSVKLPMRDALKVEQQTAQGLEAEGLLQRNLSPGDVDWIKELLLEYPDHTVEFTGFSRPWGTLAEYGYRAVIWEVRAY